jgi:hypothetical protein
MNGIKEILTTRVHKLHNKSHKRMMTKNGMLDKVDLQINKSFSIIDALDNLNHLVKHTQDYPVDNGSIVHFDTDIVVMSREDYNELLKLTDGIN